MNNDYMPLKDKELQEYQNKIFEQSRALTKDELWKYQQQNILQSLNANVVK